MTGSNGVSISMSISIQNILHCNKYLLLFLTIEKHLPFVYMLVKPIIQRQQLKSTWGSLQCELLSLKPNLLFYTLGAMTYAAHL